MTTDIATHEPVVLRLLAAADVNGASNDDHLISHVLVELTRPQISVHHRVYSRLVAARWRRRTRSR